MLDELFDGIIKMAGEATQETALQTLEEIQQLVQAFMSDGLLGFVRKVAARMSSPLFDDELDMLIAAAKDDMIRLGIAQTIVGEAQAPLVRLAITTYCKAHFGLANADSTKYLDSYHLIVDEMRGSQAYREVE